jgi:hypothetical protein
MTLEWSAGILARKVPAFTLVRAFALMRAGRPALR